jgi:hypothetical protein
VQKELTLVEFHASDPQRVAAPEVPYGSLWREFAPVPTYRLAWVPATGELYAMELSEADEDKDPVEVLGVLWSRPQVEACLAGWSERCGGQRSLLWARDQIASWRLAGRRPDSAAVVGSGYQSAGPGKESTRSQIR